MHFIAPNLKYVSVDNWVRRRTYVSQKEIIGIVCGNKLSLGLSLLTNEGNDVWLSQGRAVWHCQCLPRKVNKSLQGDYPFIWLLDTFSVELRHSIANGQGLVFLLSENLTLAAKIAKMYVFSTFCPNYPSGQSDVEKMLNHSVEKTLKNSCICKWNRRWNINFISTYNFNVEKMLNHSVEKTLKNSCICKWNRRRNINFISTYNLNVEKMLNHSVEKTLKNSCICKRNRRWNINVISTYIFNIDFNTNLDHYSTSV